MPSVGDSELFYCLFYCLNPEENTQLVLGGHNILCWPNSGMHYKMTKSREDSTWS